ncbi:hypothetical protein [Deinococcus murrayi]|uniref:hypothetical protein n=1 Tax=Deinococcus murrayi TaxID=68910 RepID=UPI000486CF8E|nr:hypothetical protein [Deinococcus murrayi]
MKKILMLTAFALAGLAAAQDTTTTETQQTETTETTTVETTTAPVGPAALSAEENFARAQEYAVQADVAYPLPFYDRTLWKAAVDHAFYAAQQEPSNRDYQAYLAQLYTKTQWWINAYNAWLRLGNLNETERQLASLSAAKLAYIALQRGDRAAARTYVDQGLSWADSASLRAIQSRL